MTIDWASLGLVAITTVVAALAIIGIFSLGVVALTSDVGRPNPVARLSGYACVGVAGLLVVYGLYLIVPQFH
jgi:hypothetical protein